MGIMRVFRESIILPVVWAHLEFKDLFAYTSFKWLDFCSHQRLLIFIDIMMVTTGGFINTFF